jgi:hypothetical protein
LAHRHDLSRRNFDRLTKFITGLSRDSFHRFVRAFPVLKLFPAKHDVTHDWRITPGAVSLVVRLCAEMI